MNVMDDVNTQTQAEQTQAPAASAASGASIAQAPATQATTGTDPVQPVVESTIDTKKLNNVDTEVPAGTKTVEELLAKAKELSAGLDEKSIIVNLDPDAGFNTNWDTLFRAVMDENGNKVAAAVYQMPTVSVLVGTDEGKAFVERIVQAAMMRRISSTQTAWLKTDRSEPIDLPMTVSEFSTAAKPQGSGVRSIFPQQHWKHYRNAIKTHLVDKYAAADITLDMNAQTLERALENQAIATVYFPQIPSTSWDQVIEGLLSLPPYTYKNSKGNEVTDDGKALYAHWKSTRYDVNDDVEQVEISLDDLTL